MGIVECCDAEATSYTSEQIIYHINRWVVRCDHGEIQDPNRTLLADNDHLDRATDENMRTIVWRVILGKQHVKGPFAKRAAPITAAATSARRAEVLIDIPQISPDRVLT